MKVQCSYIAGYPLDHMCPGKCGVCKLCFFCFPEVPFSVLSSLWSNAITDMSHKDRFVALSAFLKKYECYWRESAFYGSELLWQQVHPELSDKVLGLTDAEFALLDSEPEALQAFLESWIPGYEQLTPLLALARKHQLAKIDQSLNQGVPGRKWQQIEHFVAAVSSGNAPKAETVFDWCSGKSYMGRALAHSWSCGLHAVELQKQLCEQGEVQAKKWLDSVHFTCTDVLKASPQPGKTDAVVALHACGDLHRTLLRQWLSSDSAYLAFAPCCYHQWLKSGYQPLSLTGQALDLSLNKLQVRLAVQEMVTSSERERKQVRHMAMLRMAFDLIQRDIRGVDEYMPTPSLAYGHLTRGDEYVIRELAKKKRLSIPDGIDFSSYISLAHKRYQRFLRMQLVSHGFRRALELWLVLDLVLYLEEGGAKVEVFDFCDRAITPRNFCIIALRP